MIAILVFTQVNRFSNIELVFRNGVNAKTIVSELDALEFPQTT